VTAFVELPLPGSGHGGASYAEGERKRGRRTEVSSSDIIAVEPLRRCRVTGEERLSLPALVGEGKRQKGPVITTRECGEKNAFIMRFSGTSNFAA